MKIKHKKKRNYKLLEVRNQKIVARFETLVDVTENGVSKFNLDYIYMKLENEFFVTKEVLQQIIKGRYKAKYHIEATNNNNEQLNLFDK
jgi:hypothetical protein